MNRTVQVAAATVNGESATALAEPSVRRWMHHAVRRIVTAMAATDAAKDCGPAPRPSVASRTDAVPHNASPASAEPSRTSTRISNLSSAGAGLLRPGSYKDPSMAFSGRSCFALAAASLCATLASGCGGSGTLTAQEYPAAAEQLVSSADLGRINPASPEYTVMAWWRDAQFSDFSGYLSHLTRSVRLRVTSQQLERELPILAGGIRTAKPRILSAEVVGDSATVYAKIVFRQPIGATRYVTTTRPQAFHLLRVRDSWRLADTFFADSITGQALKAADSAKS
jgi:hypothetical protein